MNRTFTTLVIAALFVVPSEVFARGLHRLHSDEGMSLSTMETVANICGILALIAMLCMLAVILYSLFTSGKENNEAEPVRSYKKIVSNARYMRTQQNR